MTGTGSIVRPEEVRHRGQQLDEVTCCIGACFPRSEARTRVRAYLAGLLGPAWFHPIVLRRRAKDTDPAGLGPA